MLTLILALSLQAAPSPNPQFVLGCVNAVQSVHTALTLPAQNRYTSCRNRMPVTACAPLYWEIRTYTTMETTMMVKCMEQTGKGMGE